MHYQFSSARMKGRKSQASKQGTLSVKCIDYKISKHKREVCCNNQMRQTSSGSYVTNKLSINLYLPRICNDAVIAWKSEGFFKGGGNSWFSTKGH